MWRLVSDFSLSFFVIYIKISILNFTLSHMLCDVFIFLEKFLVMKKLTVSALFFMSTAFTYAHAAEPYLNAAEMGDDVSLLAQSSLLYKDTLEQRMYDNTQMICRGIKYKYESTPSKTASMERWMSKVESICVDYN